jgi:phloroglucinol synthase
MATLCRPAVVLPDYPVTAVEMLAALRARHPDHPDWQRLERMVSRMQIDRRYLAQSLADTMRGGGQADRAQRYFAAATRLGHAAARKALVRARLQPGDVTHLIVVSCTGWTMPGLDVRLAHLLGLGPSVQRLPIAQLGCAAGASAIRLAGSLVRDHADGNALIVAVELPSLVYQPTDDDLSDLLSACLFGDAAGAVAVRGDDDATGIRLQASGTFLLPDSEHYIRYDVTDEGWHFKLDRAVVRAIPVVAPVMREFVNVHAGCAPSELGWYALHTGGRRILDDLVASLGLTERRIAASRDSLRSAGNLISVSILDVLDRTFAGRGPVQGTPGLVSAFGPGFTVEMSAGIWQEVAPVRRRRVRRHHAVTR